MENREKIRVLIVDDIAETRESVSRMLNFDNNIEVVGTARTGKEAIQVSQQVKPDVIVMDINMPVMDGITATGEIKKKSPHIQIIILSVQSDPSYMRRAMLAGARDFLTKPPMIDEITDAVRRAGLMAHEERKKIEQIFPILGSGEPTKENLKKIILELVINETRFHDLNTHLDMSLAYPVFGLLFDRINSVGNGVYHDTRSPLGIINDVCSDLLNSNYVTSQKDLIEEIINRVSICYWITDNFLRISISEKLTYSHVNLYNLIEKATEFSKLFLSKDVSIRIFVPKDLSVIGDKKMLQHVFMNLVVNSIESMPNNKGIIIINSEISDDKILITIEDDGNEVSPTILPHLFKLGTSSKPSHFGTGLFIAKRLVQQQHGEIFYSINPYAKKGMFAIKLNFTPPFYQVPDFDDVCFFNDLTHSLKKSREDINTLEENLRQNQESVFTKEQKRIAEDLYQNITNSFAWKLSGEIKRISDLIEILMRTSLKNDDNYENDIKVMKKSCEFAKLLSRNFIEVGEDTKPDLCYANPIDVIQEAISMLGYKLIPGIFSVTSEIDPLVDEIRIDTTQIKQVFINLFRNAIDAMPNGGVIHYSIQSSLENIVFEVRDSGVGIPKENLQKLFTLGFTTKSGGSGIGLYSIKRIIEKHGGTIHVKSLVSKGTTFTIYLPINQHREE